MGKSKDELRDHAAWLYVSENLSLTQISERIDIPMKTLSAWKKGRKGEPDWDTRKRSVLGSPTRIKEMLLNKMETLAKETDVNAEKIVKIASAIAKIDKKLNPEIITSVLMMYESYLAKEDPAEAVRCLPFHKKFILHLINNGQI